MKRFFNSFKTLSICMAFALIFVLGVGTVSAASAPSSITVKKADRLSDLVTNYEYGFTIFSTSDGKTVYCMDVDLKPLTNGQKATLSGNGDAGLLYLLQNGYPAKEITGNDEMDKYITQAAVWWYVNENNLSSEFKNATKATDSYELVSRFIKPMVEKAKSAKDTQANPSMELITSDKAFSLTSDASSYESPYMSATLVNAKTYNVSLTGAPNGTKIVAEDGSEKTTFNSSERFKIVIPASEVKDTVNITVKTTASGSVQKAKIYKPSDSTYQRVVGLYDDETTVEKSVNLSITGGDTPELVVVPNTSANIIFASVFGGVLVIAVGVGIIIYRGRKNQN